MELLPYADTEADRALTEELESDPEVMRELGGPHTAEEIAATHERRANQLELDDWWLKIVPESGGPAVGTIGIWPTEHDGERIYEVGWMVLPRHQGKGIASRARSHSCSSGRGPTRGSAPSTPSPALLTPPRTDSAASSGSASLPSATSSTPVESCA
jgi:GNAT superfamily N-acetyltransferase